MSGHRTVHLARRVALAGVSAVLAVVGTLVAGAAPAYAVTDYSTTPTASWYPTDGVVRSVLVTPDTIYLGGSFTRMRSATSGQTVVRNRLAAIDRSTGQLTGWNPDADNAVWTLLRSGDVVYAGGDFTTVGGGSALRLAALSATTGSRVPGFTASANNQVRDLVLAPQGLYVGGRFGTMNGSPRSGVALVDAATGATSSWRVSMAGGRAFALTDSPGGLLVGGNFDSLNGIARPGLAQLDYLTGTVTPWSPQPICDCPVFDLDTDLGSAYAAVGGGGGGRAVAWSLATGGVRFLRQGDGDVQTIDYYDGRVYVGGHFGPGFMGQLRHQLVVLDAASGALQSYALPFTGNDHPGLWSVHADETGLFIGGGFALSTSPTRRFGEFSVV